MGKTEFLRVGVVVKPHGVKGDVKVYPTTDDLSRFTLVPSLLVEKNGARTEMKVEHVSYFKGMVLLKLSGVSNMDEAELYRNAELYIHRSQSPLKEGEHFLCDLIGLRVYRDDGSYLGEVRDVLLTGANAVLSVIREDGKEVLIPKIPLYVPDVDLDAERMTVHLIPGMEE